MVHMDDIRCFIVMQIGYTRQIIFGHQFDDDDDDYFYENDEVAYADLRL